MLPRKGVWRRDTSGRLRVTRRRGWSIMILLFPLCSNVNVYGFLHSNSFLYCDDKRASEDVNMVLEGDMEDPRRERMASSERAGNFSNIEHHRVAASRAASRYVLGHSISPLTQHRQCLHVSELGRAISPPLSNASERVAMHASR